jgi:drug/metabolite transporter (DMT)-like permease
LNKRLLAFLQAMLVVALWSASPPLSKIAYAELTPVQVTAIRYCGAFLALSPLLWLRSRPTLRALEKTHWLQLVIMGILGFSLGNTVLYIGLKTLPATTTSFLMNGIPIATVILGLITLREMPGWLQWIGILLAIIGGLVFFGGKIEIIQMKAVGLSLLGVVLISIYGLIARSLTRSGRIDAVSLSAFPMGFGSIFLIAFSWPFPTLSWRIIGILVWLTLINSAIAFVIWNNALKYMQAFEISITANLMPIGTALLAPIILGEPVSRMAWLGMVVSLIGVVLVGIGGRSILIKSRVV